MEAGLSDTLRDWGWIVGLMDANAPDPKKPGPTVGTKYALRALPQKPDFPEPKPRK